MAQDKAALEPGDVLPNDVKSIVGQWYPFDGAYMIEPVKEDPAVHDYYKPVKYRINIKFPTKARSGINPDQLVLRNDDDDWGCYYYHMQEDDVPKQMATLARYVRDQKREIKALRKRNSSLEKHFSRTAYDQMMEAQEEDKKPKCGRCDIVIDKAKLIEGLDWITLDDEETYHIRCAVNILESICEDCGGVWTAPDGTCPHCDGHLRQASKREIKKHLVYDAVKHYLPKELHDKVRLLKS